MLDRRQPKSKEIWAAVGCETKVSLTGQKTRRLKLLSNLGTLFITQNCSVLDVLCEKWTTGNHHGLDFWIFFPWVTTGFFQSNPSARDHTGQVIYVKTRWDHVTPRFDDRPSLSGPFQVPEGLELSPVASVAGFRYVSSYTCQNPRAQSHLSASKMQGFWMQGFWCGYVTLVFERLCS